MEEKKMIELNYYDMFIINLLLTRELSRQKREYETNKGSDGYLSNDALNEISALKRTQNKLLKSLNEFNNEH